MRTVVLGPMSAEMAALVTRRQSLGLDGRDEIWEGEYHMAPAPRPWHGFLDQEIAVMLHPLARRAGLVGTGPFNLGEQDDYRVPDRGLHRSLPSTVFAAHDVDEVAIVDPVEECVTWLALAEGRYRRAPASDLLGVSLEEIAGQIPWPQTR